VERTKSRGDCELWEKYLEKKRNGHLKKKRRPQSPSDSGRRPKSKINDRSKPGRGAGIRGGKKQKGIHKTERKNVPGGGGLNIGREEIKAGEVQKNCSSLGTEKKVTTSRVPT